MPRALGLVGLIGCFGLVLLLVTLRSTSTPLELGPADQASAQQACQTAVRSRVSDARFPGAPTVESRGDGRLHLSGSVDGTDPEQPVRRNYECLVRRAPSGAYVADSVSVWQSH